MSVCLVVMTVWIAAVVVAVMWDSVEFAIIFSGSGRQSVVSALIVCGIVLCVGYCLWLVSPCVVGAAGPGHDHVGPLSKDEEAGEEPQWDKLWVLLNPHGGAGKAVDRYKRIAEPLLAPLSPETVSTEFAGYAGCFVANLVHDLPTDELKNVCVAVCGGDGTVHEMVNGLLGALDEEAAAAGGAATTASRASSSSSSTKKSKSKRSRANTTEVVDTPPRTGATCGITLAVLPGGSGNSVAMDMFSRDRHPYTDGAGEVRTADALMTRAARTLLARSTVLVDVNKVTFRIPTRDGSVSDTHVVYSMNMVGFGATADVGVLAEQFRWLGTSRYDLVGMYILLKKQLVHISISDTSSGATFEGNAVTGFVNLTCHFGKGMRATPGALLTDGLFDVCLLTETSRPSAVAGFLQLGRGAHKNLDTLQFYQESRATFTVTDPTTGSTAGVMNIDGELYKFSGPVTIESVPRAIKLVI